MKKKSNINELIKSELTYFSPMHERSLASSNDERALWRKETIRERQERISLEVFQLCKKTVCYGPFKGMKLSEDNWWGKLDLGSQCLGLYEKELLEIISKFKKNEFTTLIDIGAADGYYAVGMLFSGKVQHAICFEQSQKGRETIQRNFEYNNSPGKINILEEANIVSLSKISNYLTNKTFVIIDIEGAEFNLLTDDILNKLHLCTIFIEIHNWIENFNFLYENLLMRADKYFEINIVDRLERSTINIEELRDFTDDNRLLLTSERRPCMMRFLILKPKKHS
ncbi:hypothetical protein N5C12_03845 [Comamonas aquatica]|uniref:hypothetical protein n=1 Tax=Comamonas aquatica TaxID=225991 RepID=UPI00244AB7C2|nr:hypothetical protein [Comamonas aquatica]MDH0898491.1 hypothetical protein [Comamonas aquatica]